VAEGGPVDCFDFVDCLHPLTCVLEVSLPPMACGVIPDDLVRVF
jgi:hypothetical protein